MLQTNMCCYEVTFINNYLYKTFKNDLCTNIFLSSLSDSRISAV